MDLINAILKHPDVPMSMILMAALIYYIALHRKDMKQHTQCYVEVVKNNTEVQTRLCESIKNLKEKID